MVAKCMYIYESIPTFNKQTINLCVSLTNTICFQFRCTRVRELDTDVLWQNLCFVALEVQKWDSDIQDKEVSAD